MLSTKSPELLRDLSWNIGFYCHIILGSLALLVGWTQFSARLRKERMQLHRVIGKLYVLCVIVSGLCGIYIGCFATGGLISSVGFISLGVIWVGVTLLAFNAIRNRNIRLHQQYMIISYAACFAAVTLRFWLPILTVITGEFDSAYRIAAWLSWVPNLLVAFYIIRRNKLA